jgi:hypothetical protein
MHATSTVYQYIHPDEMIDTYSHTESDGTQLIFTCPLCGAKASFSTVERVGRCFVCEGILKLHGKYDDMAITELFGDLAPRLPICTEAVGKEPHRTVIATRPLSKTAYAYITSRGIDLKTVHRFDLLEETLFRDGIYLAWPTYAGDYELRATFPTEWEKVTPKGHKKHFTLAKLTPEPSTCIVCEGLFSALAYAQLFNRYDAWYVVLNSVSNKTKLADELPMLTAAGITDVVLALDNDQAGVEAASCLEPHCREAGLRIEQHLPDEGGDDWNDVLQGGTQRSHLDVHTELKEVFPLHDTVENLSRDNQDITADYYDQVLATHTKAVVAAPCGTGKTHAAAAYIAQRWQDGVLYVAERTEQIQEMEQLLTTHHDVPAERIGTYYAKSPDLTALHKSETYKPIALITQARMQIHSPQSYVMFHRHGKLQYRQLMIVDESLPALVILTAPMLFVESFLHRMGLTWDDTGKLAPDEIDQRINRIESLLDTHAAQPLRRVGIQYLEWTNYLQANATSIGIRRHAYYLMLYQILSGKYLRRADAVDVLIPMAPHMTWFKLFEQILTLDATAHITDYLYQDYAILRPGTWNFHKIVEGYKFYSSIGNLTKTNAAKHRETFVTELHDHVAPLLADRGFDDPYVVTYKTLNGTSFVDDVKSAFGVAQVANYGGTRGSNQFRSTSSAVLIGSYRPPIDFDQLASILFEDKYSPYKYAVAHWVQELYRTRIRERQGETIKLFVTGEANVVEAFEDITGLTLLPSVTSKHDDSQRVERILQRLTSQAQQKLYRELIRRRQVDMKAFADRYTGRNASKVQRALRGLLHTVPELTDHIQTDETTISLVDKPAPTM